MEKIEKPEEIKKFEKKENLEEFRSKIEALKNEEIKKKEKGEFYNIHFNEIISEFLTDKDSEMFSKFEDETLTIDEYHKYKRELEEEIGDAPKDEINESKRNFYAYITNKMMGRGME